MGSYVKSSPEVTSQDHAKNVLYTIKKSEYVGRYIVAARDIQPGEVIFTDQAACIGNRSLTIYLEKQRRPPLLYTYSASYSTMQ